MHDKGDHDGTPLPEGLSFEDPTPCFALIPMVQSESGLLNLKHYKEVHANAGLLDNRLIKPQGAAIAQGDVIHPASPPFKEETYTEL